MARLQILELPEGANDSRPPYVLVVDECEPERVILGMDHAAVYSDRWTVLGERMGARGVVVTSETVEIPANVPLLPPPLELVAEREGDLGNERREMRAELKLKEFAEAQHRELVDREDAITDALGIDRLRDWGRIVEIVKDLRAHAVQGEYVDGHLFGTYGYADPLRCCRCGISRTDWVVRRDTPSCDAVLREAGGN
ncbi:hypothetical protein [Streptomyces sp. NPDC005548]|uniref:hypothetical protein n=1 Tax=Streptomyces sp. NPDC005548 TaxID=3364724 RepID=UPI0036B8BEE7